MSGPSRDTQSALGRVPVKVPGEGSGSGRGVGGGARGDSVWDGRPGLSDGIRWVVRVGRSARAPGRAAVRGGSPVPPPPGQVCAAGRKGKWPVEGWINEFLELRETQPPVDDLVPRIWGPQVCSWLLPEPQLATRGHNAQGRAATPDPQGMQGTWNVLGALSWLNATELG